MIALQPSSALWALPVLMLWAISPYFAYHTGLPRQGDRQVLEARERRELRQTARLTWRFFEEVVTRGRQLAGARQLSGERPDPIAHRTSPTNIGLQMMATVSAWDLGYISAAECLTRLDRTVDTLHKLPRYRGHFFNWYDTQSLVPLAPLYVSTVDSGNLLGYLMTVTNALPSIVEDELLDRSPLSGRACPTSLDLFERDATPVVASLGRESARDFRADLRRIRAAVDETPVGVDGVQRLAAIGVVGDDGAGRPPSRRAASTARRRYEGRRRHLVARRGRIDDSRAAPRSGRVPAIARRRARARCRPRRRASPARWRSSSTRTELDFLFDRERHLFAIGYNVTEGRRDSTYYDALASEARLASFVAIAMRHVSQEHWFKLGRLMTPVGPHRALVSWSASMFEYLMPLLVMRTYPRTLLDETYEAVISRHIEYAKAAGRAVGHLRVRVQRAGCRRRTINIAPSASPASG